MHHLIAVWYACCGETLYHNLPWRLGCIHEMASALISKENLVLTWEAIPWSCC